MGEINLKEWVNGLFNRDYTKFSNLCKSIQAIVTSMAIVIGGYWGYHTFHALYEQELASYKVKNALLDIDRKTKEQKGKVALEVSVEARQLVSRQNTPYIETESEDTTYRYIQTTVTIKNNGTRTSYLTILNKPITVAHIIFLGNGLQSTDRRPYTTDYTYKIPTDDGARTGTVDKVYIPVSASKKLTYLTRVEQRGIYQIRFESPANTENTEDTKGVAQPSNPNISDKTGREKTETDTVFNAATYLVVE